MAGYAKHQAIFIKPTFIIDSEGLAPVGEYLVLAHVAVARRAVSVSGLDAHDLVVYAALIHGLYVRGLTEHRRELVHVRHSYVNWHPEGEREILKYQQVMRFGFVD